MIVHAIVKPMVKTITDKFPHLTIESETTPWKTTPMQNFTLIPRRGWSG